MNREQQSVRLLRQLQAESQLLDRLETVCDQFGSIVSSSFEEPPKPLNLKPAEEGLRAFVEQARQTIQSRQEVMRALQGTDPETPLTIRNFIALADEPLQTQLENQRSNLATRLHALRAQVAGDTAVVCYTFDFYRRIVNGLVDCVTNEQSYGADGTNQAQALGKFYRKAV